LQWFQVHSAGSRAKLKLDVALPAPVPCEVIGDFYIVVVHQLCFAGFSV
jgi:hypothetical protein